jgi:two-component system sensor histidine kinase DevS
LSVSVAVKDNVLRIVVVDDGKGIPVDVSPSGLGNLRERAEAVGGLFSLGPGPEGGVKLEWSAPLG